MANDEAALVRYQVKDQDLAAGRLEGKCQELQVRNLQLENHMDVLKCGLEESQQKCESTEQDLKSCQLQLDIARESLRREEAEVKC